MFKDTSFIMTVDIALWIFLCFDISLIQHFSSFKLNEYKLPMFNIETFRSEPYIGSISIHERKKSAEMSHLVAVSTCCQIMGDARSINKILPNMTNSNHNLSHQML